MIALGHHSRRITALTLTLPLAFSLSACSVGFTTPAANDADSTTSVSQQDEEPTTDEAASKESDTSAQKPKDSTADKKAGDKKEKAASPSTDNNAPKEVLASWEAASSGSHLRLDVNSVTVSGSVTTVTVTATNTGAETIYGGWQNAFANSASDFKLAQSMKLIDPKAAIAYLPGKTKDGACLCTTGDALLKPGESFSMYATYKALPDGVETANVLIEGAPAFENLPVTRK